jgi:hypothetical protein
MQKLRKVRRAEVIWQRSSATNQQARVSENPKQKQHCAAQLQAVGSKVGSATPALQSRARLISDQTQMSWAA